MNTMLEKAQHPRRPHRLKRPDRRRAELVEAFIVAGLAIIALLLSSTRSDNRLLLNGERCEQGVP